MEKQIQYILDNFNFEKVNQAMIATKWKWGSDPEFIPTMAQLRECAEGLLRDAVNGGGGTYATGGFSARLDEEKILTLDFTLEACDSQYWDESAHNGYA